MRGFKIIYRNGETDLINSEVGTVAGTIDFEEGDVLVGLTLQCSSENDKRPRKFGFTIMRNAQSSSFSQQAAAAIAAGSSLIPQGGAGGVPTGVRETRPIGNEFRLEQTWPTIASLQGRQDVNNMRLKSISYSRWANGDHDFSGLKVKNNQDQESDIMGTTRFEYQTCNLK